MKPLVLIVPEKLGPEPSQWKVGIGGVLTHRRAVAAGIAAAASKRFTDAELAAEVWHSISSYFALEPSPEASTEARRNRIIERFAMLPHYDEVTE